MNSPDVLDTTSRLIEGQKKAEPFAFAQGRLWGTVNFLDTGHQPRDMWATGRG